MECFSFFKQIRCTTTVVYEICKKIPWILAELFRVNTKYLLWTTNFRYLVKIRQVKRELQQSNEPLHLTHFDPHFTVAHCSNLDIYISQKTRLCIVNLEGQFRVSLEAKLINFLIWKFRSIILIFLLFFAGIVKSSASWTLSMHTGFAM